MFKYFLILFLSFGFVKSDAQTDHSAAIDSIKQELKGNLNPAGRIDRNLMLVSLYKFSHPDVDSLIEASLAFSEERKAKFYIARSLRFRARYNLYVNSKKEVILADLQRMERISKTKPNKLIPIWVSSISAHYYLLAGNLDSAKIHIDSLDARMFEGKYTSARGSYHTIRGMYYQQAKQYTEAINQYTIALSKPQAGVTFVYNNLARLYLEMEDPIKAADYAKKSLTFGRVENNTITEIESHVILGEIELLAKDTTKALSHFEKAETIRNEEFNAKNYTAINHLVDIYKKRDPSKLDGLLANIDQFELIEVYPILLIEKGLRAFRKGDYQQAKNLCKEGLEKAEERLRYADASKGCDCLIEVFLKENDSKNEATYLRKKIIHQASINDDKRIVSMAKNLASFESQKEKELLKQGFEKDQLILNERLGKYQIGGVLGFLILLLGLVSIWQLRKRNQKINNQNQIISKALSEKDILLREIHHRVKNNLQLISSILTLQGRSIDNAAAQKAINEGKSRVRSMALIHQGLYSKESLTGLSVKEYLEKLGSELFSTYKIDQNKIDFQTEIQDIELDVDTLVPLGLIINELITNSLKYAFADQESGFLFIGLEEQGKELVLQIKDNGVGYDPNAIKQKSFGKTLVNVLTEQLEGTLQVDASDGTAIKLTITDYKVTNRT